MKLSKHLKALRGDYTQVQLARLMGVSPSLVSSWESGRVLPPALRLRKYAELFGETQPTLIGELLAELAASAPLPPTADPDVMSVLKDIRWLLMQIRDRLYDGDAG